MLLVILRDSSQVVWEGLRLWVTNRTCPLRKFSQQWSRTPSGGSGLSSYTRLRQWILLTVGAFTSVVCFDGIFLVFCFFCIPFTCQLACSHVVPCFATKGLIFCFGVPELRPYLSVLGTPSLSQLPQSACDFSAMRWSHSFSIRITSTDPSHNVNPDNALIMARGQNAIKA